MPAMLRIDGRATKIAYAVLGKPANMENKSIFSYKVNAVLDRQQTYRAK